MTLSRSGRAQIVVELRSKLPFEFVWGSARGADKKAMGDLGRDSCLRFRFVGGGGGASNWSARRGGHLEKCSVVHRRKDSPGSTCRMVAKAKSFAFHWASPI